MCRNASGDVDDLDSIDGHGSVVNGGAPVEAGGIEINDLAVARCIEARRRGGRREEFNLSTEARSSLRVS